MQTIPQNNITNKERENNQTHGDTVGAGFWGGVVGCADVGGKELVCWFYINMSHSLNFYAKKLVIMLHAKVLQGTSNSILSYCVANK